MNLGVRRAEDVLTILTNSDWLREPMAALKIAPMFSYPTIH